MKFKQANLRSAKLSPEQVFEIRRLFYEERWTQRALGERFNVAMTTIGRITRGESWRQFTQHAAETSQGEVLGQIERASLEGKISIPDSVIQASLARLDEKLKAVSPPPINPMARAYDLQRAKAYGAENLEQALGELEVKEKCDDK